MHRCAECGCLSRKAPAWIALLVSDPDEDERPSLVMFCPPCAAREFEYELKAPYT
jgi:hypothetical protein